MLISGSVFRDKIEGFWVGQCVGNFMGLPFEAKYSEPMPSLTDRYHSWPVEKLSNLQGAFTDDDTDIEWVTLHAVEEHGLDVTYTEIASEWREHINSYIWLANRRARDLMSDGLEPPATGSRANNQWWYAIDPQLVNEIWSAFYPGMLERAVDRAEWGARITSDDWGTHPTMFYAALYSGAFFSSDVQRLYDIGVSFIPSSSPFAQGLQDIKTWHSANSDWKETWWLIHNKYWEVTMNGDYMFSAVTNGLMGAMAFLYGDGDFLRTVGIAIAAGLDNDNQAATLAGLIGVMHGSSMIPRFLTHDVLENRWDKPFNDRYINERRDGFPYVNSITDIVDRIVKVAEAAISENSGEVIGDGAEKQYRVAVTAALTI
jgi:ADP-ribosylglycohydrolase